MDGAMTFLFTHPFWAWAALGAVLLAIELSTGSGWLLWPAACAGLLAIVTLVFAGLPWPWAVLLFAALTIITTYVARKMFRPASEAHGPDINDPMGRLIGHQGTAVTAFVNGAGRVFVDGKEWAAQTDGSATVTPDQKIEVTAINGATLQVKAA